MTTFGVLVHIHGPRSFERFEATAELAVRCAELAYDMFKIPLTLSKIDFLVVKVGFGLLSNANFVYLLHLFAFLFFEKNYKKMALIWIIKFLYWITLTN